jgi:hypothetical protein
VNFTRKKGRRPTAKKYRDEQDILDIVLKIFWSRIYNQFFQYTMNFTRRRGRQPTAKKYQDEHDILV